jgi:SnoaL-like protein
MSQENVSVFLECVAAVSRDDWEAAIERFDPQIDWVPQRAPVQGTYVGHDAVRRFAQDTRDTFEVFEPRYSDIRDLGDRVLAIGKLRIRGRGSGVETEVPSAVLARFESGLLIEFRDYVEATKALEAAGLRE